VIKSDPDAMNAMFSSIASHYDRANAIVSLQLYRWWNRIFIRHLLCQHSVNVYLDLCAGTGECAFTYLKKCSGKKIAVLLDCCKDMLALAQEKSKRHRLSQHDITYLVGDAQKIPLGSDCVDAVTVAYGIRNIQQPHLCIKEVYRVLKPGGVFGILELTRPSNGCLRWCHSVYLQRIVPFLGHWITSKKDAYQYLCDSVRCFISPQEIEKLLLEVGFRNTGIVPLSGGIATMISGKKP